MFSSQAANTGQLEQPQENPMARQPKHRQHWEGERDYIASVDPHSPGPNFGHDPATLETYCTMQARFARADGFEDIAEDIAGHGCAAAGVAQQLQAMRWRDKGLCERCGDDAWLRVRGEILCGACAVADQELRDAQQEAAA
jgi:hypothetical protein